MNENRYEEMDGAGLGAERREADTEAERTSDPATEAAQEVTDAGDGRPSDPDLAGKAERAEPSRQATRLEFDPANEQG